jgi:hypothetical protein
VPKGWPRPGSTVHFVTDGLESVVAKAAVAARERAVGVHVGSTIRRCLDAGLLDEIHIDLVSLLLGSGISLFDQARNPPVVLGVRPCSPVWASRICASPGTTTLSRDRILIFTRTGCPVVSGAGRPIRPADQRHAPAVSGGVLRRG